MTINGINPTGQNVPIAPQPAAQQQPPVAAQQQTNQNISGSGVVLETSTDRPQQVVPNRAEMQANNTRFLLERMFADQAGVERFARREGREGVERPSVFAGLENITPEQAEEYISEDGYWGVNAVSERLFNMAQSLAGDDPARMERMRGAVEAGFAGAERVWGGELPQISHDTLAATMELFDNWFAGRV